MNTKTTHMPIATRAADPAVEQTFDLISSDMVDGTTIYDTKGSSMGSVRNMMIDKRSGQVSYVVASIGGFLGIGAELHPLPWRALAYDTSLGGYRIGVSREKLEKAPHYSATSKPWANPEYPRSVSDYYGYPL